MKYFYTLLLITLFGSIYANAITSKPPYIKGWYCDSLNQKHEGYIRYDELNFTTFFYKENLNSKKEKFGLADALCFSFDNRLFNKIREVRLSNGLWKSEKPEVFAEVIVEGKASVYRVFGKLQQGYFPTYNANGAYRPGYGAGGVTQQYRYETKQLVNYIIKLSTNTEFELLFKNKAKFQEQISGLLKDNEALSSQISAKGYTLNNIKEIVEDYNK